MVLESQKMALERKSGAREKKVVLERNDRMVNRMVIFEPENNRLARYSAGTGWLLTSRYPAEYLAEINYFYVSVNYTV